MQADFEASAERAALARLGKAPPPPDIFDFGFHFPSRVKLWHGEWSRNGNLPDAGGVDDQDERKYADVLMYEALIQQQVRIIKGNG